MRLGCTKTIRCNYNIKITSLSYISIFDEEIKLIDIKNKYLLVHYEDYDLVLN